MELAGMIQIQLSEQHLRPDIQHTVLVFQILFYAFIQLLLSSP